MMKQEELLHIIQRNKESAINFRQRRHDDWTENYTLYRDKVLTNRLTQRQSVNIPLMKTAIKTLLKDVDEPPLLYFDNLDNDKQKEVFYNEYWKEMARDNKLVIKDLIDKKQVMLFGRSFKKLNIKDGKFYFEIVDPQDVLVDRYVDPANLDSARYIIHQRIYKPLSVLERNEIYKKSEINKLKKFYATEEGLLKAQDNMEDFLDKNARLEHMGVLDVHNPILGEVYVELNEIYMYMEPDDPTIEDDEVIHLITVADDMCMLHDPKPLCDIIGHTPDNYWYNHYNWTSWCDDPERTDFWSDGVADVIRTPNKVLNAWASQLVENRTLRNFGMHYYNATNEAFVPQTFIPVPWGWYPVPGNPDELIKKVEVPDLSDSLDEISFLLNIAEKAVAATPAQQGVTENRQVTLGEVRLALSNAKARVKSMAIFYNDSWIEFGHKYIKMIEAAHELLDEVQITRKGRNGQKTYSRVVKPSDMLTKTGYQVDVKMFTDKIEEDVMAIQKLQAARQIMPDNSALDEIFKRKVLEFAGLSVEELKSVLEEEKIKKVQQTLQTIQGAGQLPMVDEPVGNPSPEQLPLAG